MMMTSNFKLFSFHFCPMWDITYRWFTTFTITVKTPIDFTVEPDHVLVPKVVP